MKNCWIKNRFQTNGWYERMILKYLELIFSRWSKWEFLQNILIIYFFLNYILYVSRNTSKILRIIFWEYFSNRRENVFWKYLNFKLVPSIYYLQYYFFEDFLVPGVRHILIVIISKLLIMQTKDHTWLSSWLWTESSWMVRSQNSELRIYWMLCDNNSTL